MATTHRATGTVSVELSHVTHWYSRDVCAVRDVSLTLGEGVTALVGVNGAGKSTLLGMLGGGLRPTSGSVTVEGVDLYGGKRGVALRSIGLMPQSLTLPNTLTALEVVSVLGWMRGLPTRIVRDRAGAALEAVGLEDKATRRVKELSGGMRRRVALAQAIVASPQVLLLDEPSTGLDPQQRRRVVEIIKELEGTVLFSSHVMEDVADIAERVVILHEGRVAFDGATSCLEDMAPADTAPARRAETAFLSIIAASDGTSAQ